MSALVIQLARDFVGTLGVDWRVPHDLIQAAHAAVEGCRGVTPLDDQVRHRNLLALINLKFRLNRQGYQTFLDAAAKRMVFPNYHDKLELQHCLDHEDHDRLRRWLATRDFPQSLVSYFLPIGEKETLLALHEQLRSPVIKRRDARECTAADRREEILRSLFGSYVFCSFPVEAMHRHFNSESRIEYHASFFQHLKRFYAGVLHRDCALIYVRVDDRAWQQYSEAGLRNALCGVLARSYDRLANHCHVAVLLTPSRNDAEDRQWTLCAELILFAEKHRQTRLNATFFSPHAIERATKQHIPNLDARRAQFTVANEGFFFRDCIVIQDAKGSDRVKTSDEPVSLLVLLEKNDRDETLIPCPACRSTNVAANSYPILGVRSWECQNPICPARSAFDRGNRYSLASLIKQEAIQSDSDQIPEYSLKKWKLDFVRNGHPRDIEDMLLRHFSLTGDQAVFINVGRGSHTKLGRQIVYEEFVESSDGQLFEEFAHSCLFERFIVDQVQHEVLAVTELKTGSPKARVFHGDCCSVLRRIEAESIHGAVTSPPYYNARSYAEWPNIYCYLHDMYSCAKEVFRVLTPGAIYVFNIFDYFDNENSIVLSTMGKKRMILGAYIVDLFRRVGFKLERNVVWYKGEIEGKRNYNQGNRSPYYQFPLNCWEHVLIFRKPGTRCTEYRFPTVLAAKPVIKMVKGKNVHGHTAPFPPEIPALLVSQMEPGQWVLDPYAGSMTTALAAFDHGVSSISIEIHQEYCRLGLQLLNERMGELPLFKSAELIR